VHILNIVGNIRIGKGVQGNHIDIEDEFICHPLSCSVVYYFIQKDRTVGCGSKQAITRAPKSIFSRLALHLIVALVHMQ